MSQTIDNQIVKMQFDNASFEKNAQQTMSTLERLKAALKFDKVNMTPLQQAFAETEATATKAGLSIRDIWLKMGNIIEDQVATKIVNAGKKIMNALSFEGINDGFNEYELKMGSIQTIMAGTGASLATVNKYLDELNTYSDKTIYSFADMTNSIGKFTNAGVKLDDAVNAIKGIANEAAVSGANANEASRAMYNFAQALSSGYVKLIDWKSIENANMATVEFKDTLLRMGVACKTVVKESDGMYKVLTENNQGKTMDDLVNGTKNFNDSLQYQWMTTDVLTKTLKVYATDIRELTAAEKDRYEAELEGLGYSQEEIIALEQLGIKAANSATEIKTFTMLIDTLKEAIGSGWAMSWQYIIGDFEQAKAVFTDMGNVLGGAIDTMSDARNRLLKSGLQTGWEKFTTMTNKAIPESEEYRQILLKTAMAHGVLSKEQVVEITSTNDLVKSMHELKWVTGDLLVESVSDYTKTLESMSKEEREAAGVTDDQLAELQSLNRFMQANKDKGNGYIESLAKGMNELGGRENILAGLKNLFHGLTDSIKPVGEAFNNVFGVMDPKNLFNFTVRFREFTEQMKVSTDAANTIRTAFTLAFGGIKTILGGVSTAISGVTKLVLPLFNLFDAIFGLIGKVVAALTGSSGALGAAEKFSKIGDKISDKYLRAMQKLANFINKVADAIRGIPDAAIFDRIHDSVERVTNRIAELWDSFTSLPVVKQMIADFNASVEKVQKNVEAFSKKVEQSFKNIQHSTKKYINWNTVNTVLTAVYTKVKNLMTLMKQFAERIKEFFTDLKDGKTVVESFKENFGDIIDKIKELKKNLDDFFDNLFSKGDEMGKNFNLEEIAKAIHDFVTNISPDQITLIAVSAGFALITFNLLRLSDAMRNAVDSFTGIGVALKNVINSYVKKQKSTILQVAEAIVIVTAALWVLTTVTDKGKLDNAVGALAIVTALLVELVAALTVAGIALKQFGGEQSFVKLASGLAIVAGAMLVAVMSLKALEYVNLDWKILPKLALVAVVLTSLSGLALLLSKMENFSKGSLTLLAVAGSLLVTATALAEISSIPSEKLEKSIDTMLKMMVGLAALIAASSHIGLFSSIGFLSVVLMFNKLLPSIEKIVNYDYEKINKGLDKNKEMFKRLGGVIVIMAGIGILAGKRLKGVGIGLAAISGAFAIFVGIAKLAGSMNPGELKRGETFILHMAALIALMELCFKKSRIIISDGKGANSFIKISIAMGIMLGIAKLASLMDTSALIKGGVALAGLVGIIFLIGKAAEACQQSEGMLHAVAKMLVAVTTVLALVGILSFIKPKRLIAPIVAVLAVIGALAVLASQMSKLVWIYDKDKQKATGLMGFMGTVVAIAAIGATIVQLSKLPLENVGAAAGAIVVTIAALAGLAKWLSKINGNFSGKALGAVISAGLLTVGAAVLIFEVTKRLKQYNFDSAELVDVAKALKTALTGVALCIAAMGLFNVSTDYSGIVKSVAGAVLAMLGVVGAMLILTTYVKDVDKLQEVGTALAIAMAGLAVPLAVLGAIGYFCEDVNAQSLGKIVGGSIVVLAGVVGALMVLTHWGGDPNKMLAASGAICTSLIGLAVAMGVLGVVGDICKTANPAVMWSMVGGAVMVLLGISASLSVLANALDANSVKVLNDAIPVLITSMLGVGAMAAAVAIAGRLAGGNIAAVGAGFAAMEVAIVALATLVMAIALLGKAINDSYIFEGSLIRGLETLVIIAEKLGEAIGAFVGGIGVGITSTLEDIADNLNMFSGKIRNFFRVMAENSKNTDAINGIKQVADCLVELGKVNLKAKKFKKMKDIDFAGFGKMIQNFVTSVSGVTEVDIVKASICATIASKLSSIDLKAIKKKDITGFTEGISGLGMAIKMFAIEVEGIPENAVSNAKLASDTVTPIIDLTGKLKRDDGLIQHIIGSKDLGVFGTNLRDFATGIKELVSILAEIVAIDPDYKTSIQICADATQPLIDLASGIENMGGLLSGVVGDNTLDIFGQKLIPFAEGLKQFVAKISYIASHEPNYAQLIRDTASACTELINMANTLENMGGVAAAFAGDNTLSKFGETLEKFGWSLKSYAETLVDVDFEKIKSTNQIIKELLDIGKLASEVPAEAFNGLKEGLNYISQMPVSTIAEEIRGGTQTLVDAVTNMFVSMMLIVTNRKEVDYQMYLEYGKNIIKGIIDGERIYRPFINIDLIQMVGSIQHYLDMAMATTQFEGYGYNVSLGVAAGIRAGIGEAVSAASEMAAAVAAVIPEAWQEHSPSRLSYGFGKNLDLGAAGGIRDYTSEVVLAADQMSEEVVSSASKIISAISNAINNDMDTQPVIRPVLDMSDVTNKAKRIGSIFSGNDLALAYGVSSGFNQVHSIKADKVVTGAQNEPQNASQINFTQNNYSPKALSRQEIYRQTKNQLSMMKGVVQSYV